MDVEQWDIFEVRLDGPQEGNPFQDVSIEAEFTSAGTTTTVAGFYDGEGSYCIRFMPTEPGTWSFRTSSNVSSLDGQTGDFTCVPPSAGNHGPVGVAAEMHFAYADGAPFRPIGTTCYAWAHQSPEQQRRTLDTLNGGPFNKVRMCLFPKHYNYNENEPASYPFPLLARGSSVWQEGEFGGTATSDWSFDTDRFDPAFFREFEARVRELGLLGIQADVILFHPYDRWGFSRLSPEEDERYLRYVIARLASFRNVWWSLANEYDLMLSKTLDHWDRAAELVRACDPYGNLCSIHNAFQFYDHGNPAITHVSVQHEEIGRVVAWRHRYRKPVIIDECGYEGDVPEGWGNLSAQEMVHRCWTAIVSGGYVTHGETYLGESLWWSHGGTLRGESPARLAFLRELLDDAPPALEPIPSTSPYFMVASGPREEISIQSLVAAAGQQAAGGGEAPIFSSFAGVHRPHQYYLTYFGPQHPSQHRVDVPSGEVYEAAVIDTWQMTITPLPEEVGRGTVVRLPVRPYQALRLRRRA